jgi:hypothetical protein
VSFDLWHRVALVSAHCLLLRLDDLRRSIVAYTDQAHRLSVAYPLHNTAQGNGTAEAMRARLPPFANKAGYPSALLQRRSCSTTSPLLFEAVAPNAQRQTTRTNQTV